MKYADKFSEDMSKLFRLVDGECGDSVIRSQIVFRLDYDCDMESDNAKDWVESFKYNDSGMFDVLYEIANYDLVSLIGKKVNVKESNRPNIAKIVKKYVTQDMIDRVREILGFRD